MTIAAAYRFDDRAIFVSDFRMTDATGQSDTSLKFVDLDRRLGLFLSGSVGLWLKAIPKINEIMSEVTIDNILDNEGPFVQELTFVAWANPNASISRAIGFIIDDQNRRNQLFLLELRPGERASISLIQTNSCVVIGSGSRLPDIKRRITTRIERAVTIFGMDLYKLAGEMRTEIQQTLKDSGAGSFRKLGISPYMNLSSIAGSHFLIRGEEIQGGKFSDNAAPTKHFYSFIKDDSGNLILQNLCTGSTLSVNNLNGVQELNERKTFDPEGMSEDLDPSELYPDADHVYLLHQWVTQYDKEKNGKILGAVYRSLKKIDFIDVGNGVRLCKASEPFINVHEEVSLAELKKYADCRDIYIENLLQSEVDFHTELSEKRLFDHTWLSQFIPNYNELYKPRTARRFSQYTFIFLICISVFLVFNFLKD